MSQKKPGRNDPCPCGSGKKYKVCHAADDRARAAPPPSTPHPLTEDLKAAMALLGDPDVSRLSQALTRVGELLAEWGPSADLRFDAEDFDAHVGAELARLSDDDVLDAAGARRELLVGTVRKLGTRPFLERLGAALLARAGEPGRSTDDRRALCVGALLASASRKVGKARPEDIPILDVVFDVQFREWSAHHKALAEKYQVLAGGLDESTLSAEAREALQHAREGDVEALVNYVKDDPGLAERIAREARERSSRVEAKLREPSTPSVFSPDEELWLTCVLWEPMQALKSLPPQTPPAERREAVGALLRGVKGALDADFLEGMLGRLHEKAKDASADEATRAWYSDAAIAFEAEPSRMSLAALLTGRREAEGRSAEEMVALADLKALTTWTPESFEPYRQLLAGMGLTGAVERVRRVQDWLRAHPVTLRPESA
ncbi:SEC-C domain-containing protein [Myxococcus stipitatus]|uniref:YecA family protein n=1 Tax=Myxococcus stipitatus TaxID=83455 RepID=UPI001F1B0079|nr:SEC-C metal-binding domain-containing protein [Myxococcus stipitatus]MCE9667619.1 SEC-C domain-containing protein [Myxococcus stipitatus]